MELNPCPFCGESYPDYQQLNQHVNTHFEIQNCVNLQELCKLGGEAPDSTAHNSNSSDLANNPRLYNINDDRIPMNLTAILQYQFMDEQFQIDNDIIPLLENCFKNQYQNQNNSVSIVYLSGPIQHFSAREDSGWGCGWRNCQMLASNLLQKSPEYKKVSFGGASFVPHISSLQTWLEYAWCQGFDPEGRHALNGNVQGSKKWLGTTDATTIFRQFGIKTQFVDFVGINSTYHTNPIGGTVHNNISCDGCKIEPIIGMRYRSYKFEDYDLCGECKTSFQYEDFGPFEEIGVHQRHEGHECIICKVNPIIGNRYQRKGQIKQSLCCECWSALGYLEKREFRAVIKPGYTGQYNNYSDHKKLVQWVWQYFSNKRKLTNNDIKNAESEAITMNEDDDEISEISEIRNEVNVTDMSPLYFQHNGHSRTIVGIEKIYKYNRGKIQIAYNLIILDPSTPSHKLQHALMIDRNWQRLVKRGLHTLKKPEYQLVFVDDGIATKDELISLKELTSYSSIFA